jgi:hypothetical protein
LLDSDPFDAAADAGRVAAFLTCSESLQFQVECDAAQLFGFLSSLVSSSRFTAALFRAGRMGAFVRGIEEFQGVFVRNAEQLLNLLSSCEASLAETCRLDIFRQRVVHDANEIIGNFTACCTLNRR